jgi:hypothetical protein
MASGPFVSIPPCSDSLGIEHIQDLPRCLFNLGRMRWPKPSTHSLPLLHMNPGLMITRSIPWARR